MITTTDDLSLKFFGAFALRGLKNLNAVKSGDEWLPYVEWLCQEMQLFMEGRRRRLMISLPPRHLKTYLSICLAAWILAQLPWAKIMILSHNERLAEKFAYLVRELMTSPFYMRLSDTRIAQNRSTLMDFVTTARGGVYSASINSSVTGIGADFIIVDDPMPIDHCNDLKRMKHQYDKFTNEVMTRLNNPRTGSVMVIGHRLNAEDLFGRLANDGEWKHLVLPLIAPRNRRYIFPDGTTWDRAKGELLRPDAFSEAEIRRLTKKSEAPGFEILQQQNPGAARFRPVKAKHFLPFYPDSLRSKGVILSIDPGQGGTSYSVVQAWTMENGRYALIDQWRAQAPYLQLRHATFSFLRRYRPGVVLIERSAHGTALIDELANRDSLQVVPITPRESKSGRTKRLLASVRRFMVMVPEGPSWVPDFVEELTRYPNSVNDDQIDAASQAVDWMRRKGPPAPPASRSVATLVTGRQLTGQQPPDGGSGPSIVTTSVPGAALARCYFVRRRY